MSVDIIQNVSIPPLKRLRLSSTTLTDINIFKCGEVFVTNSADKWAFHCTQCDLTTSDIGVFICHIRLKHLQDEIPDETTQQSNTPITIASSRQNVAVMTPPPLPVVNIPCENLLPSNIISAKDNESELQIQSDIVKEEPTVTINQSNIDYEAICSKVAKIVDMSSLTEPESNIETSAAVINDKTTLSGDDEIDEEFVTITQAIAKTSQQELNEKVLQFVYENEETTMDHKQDIDSLTETEDESSELQQNKIRKYQYEASGSKVVKTASGRIPHPSRQLLPHKCPICNLGFKSKQGVHFHISKIHDKNLHTQLPYKCKVCDRGFKSMQGLKYHSINHDDKRKEYKCNICPGKFYKLNSFITHVLSHENETRFPCQVCGKIYDSNEKRISHREKHAKEKPFGCSICYRRFPRQQYLTHHLKSHNLYQCHFCPDEFTSKETQHIPYVCPKCDLLPDIKQKVEHLRTLASKSMKFTPTLEECKEDIFTATEIKQELTEIKGENLNFEIENKENENEDENKLEQLNNNDSKLDTEAGDGYYLDPKEDTNEEEYNENVLCFESEFLVDQHNDDNRPSSSSAVKNSSKNAPLNKKYNCIYCNRLYSTKRGLSYHMKHRHFNNILERAANYKCSYCPQTFETKGVLNFHQKTHNNERYRFNCPICPLTGFRENDYINHVLLHESDSCYPCQVCGKIASSQEQRLKHWQTHAKEKPYYCRFCYRRFRKQYFLMHHLKTHEEILHERNEALEDQDQLIIEQHNVKETGEVFYISNVDNNDDDSNDDDNNDDDTEFILNTDDDDEEDDDDDDDDNNDDNDNDNNDDLDYETSSVTEEHLANFKCSFCCEIFNKKTKLVNHLKRKHSRNNGKTYPYHCEICNKIFKSKNGMKGHSRTHEAYNQKQCPICMTSLHQSYFIRHVMMHESEWCFPCQVCGAIFDSQEKRLNHWHDHEKDYPFDCDLCSRRFKKKSNLLRHQHCHKRIKCVFCKIEFYSKDLVRQRSQRICENCSNNPINSKYPPDVKSIKDPNLPSSSGALYNEEKKECLKQENEEIIISDNISSKTLNNSSKHEQKPPPFESVTICDSDTQNIENDDAEDSDESPRSDVEFVNVLHDPGTSDSSHECKFCFKSFKFKKSLSWHILESHNRKNNKRFKFKCHLCERTFQTRSGLTFHVKTHDKSINFKCPICSKTIYRKNIFIAHVMLHENDSCYPCQVCVEIFKTSEERHEHWKAHAAEKPYPCNICYRRFITSSLLRNHMKSHGFYECKFCGHNFKGKSLRQPYVCEKCTKVPHLKMTAERQRTLKRKRREFESDGEE